MNVNRNIQPAADAGFTLIEAAVSCALLAATVICALAVMTLCARTQAAAGLRDALTTLVDNLLSGVHAASLYDDAMNADIRSGKIAANFSVDGGSGLGRVACVSQTIAGAQPVLLLRCSSTTGVTVQRVLTIPQGAPIPGSVYTAAP